MKLEFSHKPFNFKMIKHEYNILIYFTIIAILLYNKI